MSILISLEMGYNAVKMIKGLDTEFRYKSRSSYTEYRKETGDIVNKIKSSDDGFYRIEKTYERSKNEVSVLDIAESLITARTTDRRQ